MFSSVPSSNYYVLARRFSSDRRADGPLEHRIATLLPNLHRAARSPVPNSSDVEFISWLRARTQHLYPRRAPSTIDAYWQSITIDADGEHEVVDSVRTGSWKL